MGKTRVAVEAAANLLADFPDGIWFVDLSVLDDPTLVPSAIARVLGVREEGSGLTERLSSVLGGKQLLLVLDNFERVLESASLVTSLLAGGPGAKVLVTSRTPLHTLASRSTRFRRSCCLIRSTCRRSSTCSSSRRFASLSSGRKP